MPLQMAEPLCSQTRSVEQLLDNAGKQAIIQTTLVEVDKEGEITAVEAADESEEPSRTSGSKLID